MKNQFLTKAASYLIGFTLVALFSVSCSSSGDDEEEEQTGNGYKITLKVDGVSKEFQDEDFPPFGSLTDNGTQYSASFAATGRASSVGFQVYDTKAIVQKDYSGLVITPTSGHNLIYGAVLSYAESQDSYSTQSVTNPVVHVDIKEITSTSVRGEFSGTLKSQGTKADIKITEGKFYIKLHTASN